MDIKGNTPCLRKPCRSEFCAGLISGFFIATFVVFSFQRLLPNSRPASVPNSYLRVDSPAPSTETNGTNSILHSSEISAARKCSFSLVDEYYQQNKHMPEDGSWLQNVNRRLGEEYRPSVCEFGEFDLGACLKQKNITSILTIGDSQVWRSSDALFEFFNDASGGNCRKVRVAVTRLADRIKYYEINNWKLAFSGPSSERPWPYTIHCYFRDSHKVQIEYNSIYFFKEPPVRITGLYPEPTVINFQEFLFKHYLKGRKPDLLFIAPPLNHIKNAHSIKTQDYNNSLAEFIDLVIKTIPRSTPIYWLTTPAELQAAKGYKALVNHNARIEGMLATEKMYLMGRRLYDVLQPKLLDPSYNFHGFFNLYNMSSVRRDWAMDGQHLLPVWYNKTVELIYSTLCHS